MTKEVTDVSPVELFKVITEPGIYTVSYLQDGWTREIQIKAKSPENGMFWTQEALGDICSVTFVERS